MDNYYHLLLETPDVNLSKGMRQLNGVFTQAMNKKHHRVGHLFQGRYKAILVDKDAYFLELCRYIVLNPVRANMVDTPGEWSWSRWHHTVGKQAAPNWLACDAVLSYFANSRAADISLYIQFVEQGVNKAIWDDLQHQVFLGDEAFVAKHQVMQNLREGDLSEIPLKQHRAPALTLSAYQKQSATRNKAIIHAYRSGNYTMKQIGDYFSVHYPLISHIVVASK